MTRDQQVAYLLKLNRDHAAEFCGPDARNARGLYRANHPTEIAVLKCMDGRLHGPVATNTPLGILQPYRNLGGRFDMGWPHFQMVMAEWVRYAIRRGRHCLILVTYHYSAGDPHRGCAGFNYDTAAARAFTANLKRQVESVFGAGHQVVYPVQVGYETDDDAFVLHGESGEELNLGTVTKDSDGDLAVMLQRLFPDMPGEIRRDFLPLVRGNIAHIAEVRARQRPIVEVEHREWILALGRGFDWLHSPNTALIVGPWSHNLEVPVATAAQIIASNMRDGRIPGESAVLLTSAIYRDPAGSERLLAREKTLFLRNMALEVIGAQHPDLARILAPMPVVVNMETREMTLVDS